jgi:hypothetical protein
MLGLSHTESQEVHGELPMMRLMFLCLALCMATAFAPCEALAKKGAGAVQKSQAQIQEELDVFVLSYVETANKRLSVNRSKPKVTREGGKYVARFTEIDTSSVTAEVRPSKSKHFEYVARLRYHEMTYECEGKTRKAALKGPWKCVNVRRLTEMPRYAKGKWEN